MVPRLVTILTSSALSGSAASIPMAVATRVIVFMEVSFEFSGRPGSGLKGIECCFADGCGCRDQQRSPMNERGGITRGIRQPHGRNSTRDDPASQVVRADSDLINRQAPPRWFRAAGGGAATTSEVDGVIQDDPHILEEFGVATVLVDHGIAQAEG